MAIYTKVGDEGFTRRRDGKRVRKDDAHIEAVGSIDELSAQIGLCIAGADSAGVVELRDALSPLQGELLAVGAMVMDDDPRKAPALDDSVVGRMERQVDRTCEIMPAPSRSFILPGGCDLACRLHVARTVCRRAERALVAATGAGRDHLVCLRYVNRLSDLLFVLARRANHLAGVAESTWQTKNRE